MGRGGAIQSKVSIPRNSARSDSRLSTEPCTDYSNDPSPAPPPAAVDHHPAANLFPLLEVESPEFGELVRDLQEHGLLQPIVLHDGLILDGRNRYRACQHAGIEPRFVEWSGESPTAYVLSLNLHRRHLTDGQKAMIAVDALSLFEAEARARQGRRTDLRDPSTSGQISWTPSLAFPTPAPR
jgi:ParB-like nuclease domain